ncbi:MAG: hypothetical protein ACI3V0_08610 [Faecousia sp.]
MNEVYEVYYGGASAGKIQLLRQGLYVRLICRCQLPTQEVCRLFVDIGDRRESLGVVVPEGDGFILDKKIPAKRLGEGRLRFLLSAGRGEKRGSYDPICPEEPYWYIHRLKTAFLQSEHGKAGFRTKT